MGSLQITKSGMVQLRGVYLPVENVREAMLETGGIPVSDPEINARLDVAMAKAIAGGKKAKAFAIDAYPGVWFVPIKLNLFNVSPLGTTPPGGWAYFAVQRKTIINA